MERIEGIVSSVRDSFSPADVCLVKMLGCTQEQEQIRFEKSGGELLYQLKEKLSDETHFLIFDFVNHNSFDARLEIHFYSEKGTESSQFTIVLAILPDFETPVVVPFSYLDGQSMNGVQRPGILCTAIDGTRMAQQDIKYIGIAMSPCHVKPLLEIKNVRIENTDAAVQYDFSLEDLIDEFGQRKGRDWPGKTHDLTELSNYLNKELETAKTALSQVKDSYLGTGVVKFSATGYFHLENGKLITPDGKEFFSFGCAVVIPRITGPLGAEKEHDYLRANLQKVWEDKAYENWATLTKHRLLKWGMNTVAAWSDLEFAKKSKITLYYFS